MLSANKLAAKPWFAARGIQCHWFGLCAYEPTWRDMQQLTDTRDAATPDQIWFLEHPPVFTLGMNADPGHVLGAGEIPVVRIDRGGQVTYHGPGQLMVYPLIDLRRAGLGVRDLVSALEQSSIALLAEFGVAAAIRSGAPGVYVADAKIASIGIRVRRGASYHGLALNVDMDLTPFDRINPCGYADLKMTQLAEFGRKPGLEPVARRLAPMLIDQLNTIK
jgi:lipoyl(octanoyl) transferase